MIEATTEPVRRGLLIRAALAVLDQAGGPLKRAEVMRRVAESVEMTSYESAPFRDDEPMPRWENHLTWASTDMRAAGWIDKTSVGWVLTDGGREALASHPDGAGLAEEAGRAYRELVNARRKDADQPHYLATVEAALEFVEPGQWTTYSDLAGVAGTNAQTVGNAMAATSVDGAHRVVGKDGRPSTGFVWPDGRDITQREALEAEGVEFDATGAASEEQHVRTEDLRAFLEDAGVLVPLPKRAWLVRGSSVDGHDLIPTWRRDGFASLRAAKLREVEPSIGRSELRDIVYEDYSQTSYAAKAAKLDEFHAFLSRMQLGDVVCTTSQGHLYLGVTTGQAQYVKSADGLSNLRRSVEWLGEGIDYGDLPGEIKARLQIQYDVVEMTQQLDALERLLGTDASLDEAPGDVLTATAPPPRAELRLPAATQDLAGKLHVDLPWLEDCIELLRDRPQLIFYGPPGTGKTYIAQALASHLAGDNIRLVQFHPAYSYEDFFEGYRPVEAGGFALKPGPLRKVVDAARENPSTPYVLIIDEINRGNLAKIFGELYFLLEYRDQQVDLLYATGDDVGFSLPENVFIIGTMNTADRSIALVDAAMRRRFAFVPLHPSEPPTRDVLRRWLLDTKRDPVIADLLDELNARIEDPDFKIGPSYFMRSAVHAERGLERAWRTAILPLLEEHHYGDGVDVQGRYGLATIRSRVQARATASEEMADEQPADPA
ncbi:MAG: AAA family ATPase [Micropruina sp.]|uniref:AAA family ATPase n=1 Tax=Micropruina sp. TaxID=2737536 RepID=UPI0039E6B905